MNSEIDYSKSKTEFDKIGFDFKDSQRLKKIWKRFSQIYKVLKKKDLIGHFETELHKIKVNISHSDYEFIEKLQEEKKYYEKLKEKIQNLSEDNFKILEKDYEKELKIN